MAARVISSIRRFSGLAGQFGYRVEGIVSDGSDWSESFTTEFVGSAYGSPGPVVMASEGSGQVFVDDPGRFGERLNPQWVRNFYKDGE